MFLERGRGQGKWYSLGLGSGEERQGRIHVFGKGEESGKMLSIKTLCICVHGRSTLWLFMKFGDNTNMEWGGGGYSFSCSHV